MGLTVYDPGGRMAAAARQVPRAVAPTSRTGGKGAGKTTSHPPRNIQEFALLRSAGIEYTPPAPAETSGGGGGGNVFSNALGTVLNAASKPLEVLDYGRRLVTLGTEELAEGLGGRELSAQLNDDGSLKDTRSNWEKLKDPTYGVGQLLPDVSFDNSLGNFFDRGVGFTGDMILDPTTWVTAGLGGLVGKAGRAGYAATAQTVGRELAEEALAKGATKADALALIAKYDRAGEEIGRYGPGVIKDTDLLEKIGLQKQGLRFGRPLSPGEGFRIGGDTRVGDALGEAARKANVATARARAKFYDTFPKVAKWRTPEGLERAHEVIRTGQAVGGLGVRPALALVAYHDAVRGGSKAFAGEWAPAFEKLANETGKDGAVGALHAAESPAARTVWNDFGDDLAEAIQNSGVKFNTRENYVPHVWTEEGKKFLHRNDKVRSMFDLTRRDLDDPSGVTLSRKFGPGKQTIDGVELDFGTGTVQEINAELANKFGVKRALDDNITSAYANYIHKVSSDVGVMEGMETLTKQFGDLMVDAKDPAGVARIFDEILDEAATDEANSALASVWKGRLTKARRMSGVVENEIGDAVEDGRSLLSGKAKEQLDTLRLVRDETKTRLGQLEKTERSATKRRDKIADTFGEEIMSHEEKINELEQQIRQIDDSANTQISVIEDAVNQDKDFVRSRASARGGRQSARKSQLRALQGEYQEEVQLLHAVRNRLNSLDIMEDLANRRLGSEAPMPRPLPGVTPTTTQGESYLGIAGGERIDLPGVGGEGSLESQLAKADVIPATYGPGDLEGIASPGQPRPVGDVISDRDADAARQGIKTRAENARQAAERDFTQERERALREFQDSLNLTSDTPYVDPRTQAQKKAHVRTTREAEEAKQKLAEFRNSRRGQKLVEADKKIALLGEEVRAAESETAALSDFVAGTHANGKVIWEKVKGKEIGEIPGARQGEPRIDALNRAASGAGEVRAANRAPLAEAGIRERQTKIADLEAQIEASRTAGERYSTIQTGGGTGEKAEAALRPRIDQLKEEIADLEQRMQPGGPTTRYSKADIQKRYTAAVQRKKKAERMIADLKERTAADKKVLERLEATAEKKAEAVKFAPPTATPNPRGPAVQPVDLANEMQKRRVRLSMIEEEERKLLHLEDVRSSRPRDYQGPGSIVGGPNGARVRPEGANRGRTRIPSRQQLSEDLTRIEQSGQPYKMPSKREPSGRLSRSKRTAAIRRELTDRNTVFQYNNGQMSLPDIAEQMIADTTKVRDHRRTLVEAGAIPLEAVSQHVELVRNVREAMKTVKLARTEMSASPTAALSELSSALGELRRANEFIVRYSRVIRAGETPSPALERRILRPIFERDSQQLADQIKAMKNKPEAWVDEEANYYSELVHGAIEDLDDVYSTQQLANTSLRVNRGSQSFENLTPAHEMAKHQALIDSTENVLRPMTRKRLTAARSAYTKASNKGMEHEAELAANRIRKLEARLESYDTSIAEWTERVEKLKYGDDLPDNLKVALKVIEESGVGEMTEETKKALSQVFGGDVADMIYRWGSKNKIKGAETLRDSEDFQKFLRKLFSQAGVEPEQASYLAGLADRTVIGPTGVAQQTGGSPAMMIADAVKMAYKQQYNTALTVFQEVFDSLGLGAGRIEKGTAASMTGYKGGSYSKAKVRKLIDEMFKRDRGMTNYQYALNEMEMRQARMDTIARGLGKKQYAEKEIIGLGPDGAARRASFGQMDELPDLATSVDEAIAADVLPAERTRLVAQAQKREPIQAARDARNELRAGMTEGSDDFVDPLSVVFGGVGAKQSMEPIPPPRGEQRARNLAVRQQPTPRMSGGITQNSPAAERTALQKQLLEVVAANEATTARGADMTSRAESLRGLERTATDDTDQLAARITNMEEQIAKEAESPLVPEAAEAVDRIQTKADEATAPLHDELGQRKIERDAWSKAQQKQLDAIDTELGATRQSIAEINTEQEDLVSKLGHANEIALQTTKKRAAENLAAGGPANVAEDFEKTMKDLGLDPTSTKLVQTIMADAVALDGKQVRWDAVAERAESQLAKANAKELATVTKSVLLPNWTEMAEKLVAGADEETRFLMSQDLARHFTTLSKQMESGRFWKGVEAYTAFFKTYATMRPDFHIRNALSAMFMNGSDGVPIHYNFKAVSEWKKFRNDPMYLRNLRAARNEESAIKGLTNGQLADAFKAALGSGAGGQYAEKSMSRGLDTRQITSKLLNNPATRLSKTAGEYVEGPVRLAMAMDSAIRGHDARTALNRLSRIHFDYSEVSEMDRYAKRFIPFWTFMSRNLPLQYTQMLQKPRWYTTWNSFVRNFQGTADPNAPDYWASGGGFPIPLGAPGITQAYQFLGGDKDTPLYFSPDFAHTRIQEDMSNITGLLTMEEPGKMLTSLNPLFTMPLELATKKDLFTDRAYQADDVRQLGGLESVLTPLLRAAGKTKGPNDHVDELLINSMRSLIPFWEQAARIAPGVVTGNQSQLDKERQAETFARRLGLNIKALTPEVIKNERKGEYYAQLEQAAMQRALAG